MKREEKDQDEVVISRMRRWRREENDAGEERRANVAVDDALGMNVGKALSDLAEDVPGRRGLVGQTLVDRVAEGPLAVVHLNVEERGGFGAGLKVGDLDALKGETALAQLLAEASEGELELLRRGRGEGEG